MSYSLFTRPLLLNRIRILLSPILDTQTSSRLRFIQFRDIIRPEPFFKLFSSGDLFMKRMHWVLLSTLLPIGLAAQTPGQSQTDRPQLGQAQSDQRGQRRIFPGDRIFGKVTAVGKDSVTISPQGGSDAAVDAKTPVTIKVTDDTRINKQREPIKLSEIKAGDTVFAVGKRNGNSIQAAMVGVVPPEAIARMSSGQGGGRMPFGPGGQFDPADMGKKYIVGTVKAIDETKLTITRTDGQAQEIEVDENTSFRKFRESITLPDIKVGDFVMGRGELKNNIFVPKTLNVGPPQQFQRGQGADAPAPDSTKPKDTPPQH
jgi:Cu/Ag efflux protein CusF